MGNKPAKHYIPKKRKPVVTQLSAETHTESDEDLADYLAALTNMATKGSRSLDEPALPVPETSGSPAFQRLAPSTTSVKDKRERFKRSKAVTEDTSDQTSELGALLPGESSNWDEMRDWLVWCMQSNLQEEVELYRKNKMPNQSSLESNTET